MKTNEKVSPFSACIRQIVATLKSMSVQIEDSEIAMALLNGLPDRFHNLISALDAAKIGDTKLSFELVQSQCLQKEQHHVQKDLDSLKMYESAALIATSANPTRQSTSETCKHCGKHQGRSHCYKKFPHVAQRTSSKGTYRKGRWKVLDGKGMFTNSLN